MIIDNTKIKMQFTFSDKFYPLCIKFVAYIIVRQVRAVAQVGWSSRDVQWAKICWLGSRTQIAEMSRTVTKLGVKAGEVEVRVKVRSHL